VRKRKIEALWAEQEEVTQYQSRASMSQYVLFTDYNKETKECVATYMPEKNVDVLWRLMEKYRSDKSDAYQFVFTDKQCEKPSYVTDYDLQRQRSMGVRIEWAEGELVLPEMGEDPKQQMIVLFANGGIKNYMK
jgi:hypothetical protein